MKSKREREEMNWLASIFRLELIRSSILRFEEYKKREINPECNKKFKSTSSKHSSEFGANNHVLIQ